MKAVAVIFVLGLAGYIAYKQWLEPAKDTQQVDIGKVWNGAR